MVPMRLYILLFFGVLLVQAIRYGDLVKDYMIIDENYHFYDEIEMNNKSKDEDDGLTMTELVQKRGYTINTHYVTTEDGYILTIFNIPEGKTEGKTEGKSEGKTNKKPVVLLQHGLFDSSYTWINNYETQSLGYILADQGYDVWLGNNRGNTYGRNHTTLDPDKDNEFWEFTYDEMGSQDLPAMIDYIVNTTSVQSLSYVGHSEGTIQVFASGSDNIKQTKLINLFIALAPVAYVEHVRSPEVVVLARANMAKTLINRGHLEFFPNPREDHVLASDFCYHGEQLCNFMLETFCGPTKNMNKTRLQVYVSETPAGTSTYNLDHWVQGIINGTFAHYDFGSDEANLQVYGTTSPPRYDLSKFSIKTALFTGSNDILADPMDVERLVDELTPDTVVYRDNQEDFNHLDFVWSPIAAERIYRDKVLPLLKQYNV
jgi:lysosomal acid lipase/cholesteryl ester hydrolase